MVKIAGSWTSRFYPAAFGHFDLDTSTQKCTFYYDGRYRSGEQSTFEVETSTGRQATAFIGMYVPLDPGTKIVARTKTLGDIKQFMLILVEHHDGCWSGRYTALDPDDYGKLC